MKRGTRRPDPPTPLVRYEDHRGVRLAVDYGDRLDLDAMAAEAGTPDHTRALPVIRTTW